MMDGKPTGDLCGELMEAASLDAYISKNQTFFSSSSIAELLTALYENRDLSKAELARRAGMSEVYLHQVFSGRRSPSRDRLLCLCAGMEASLEETQELLKRSSFAQLYPRHKRDSIIIHGLIHHTPLSKVNDNLFLENEKTLF